MKQMRYPYRFKIRKLGKEGQYSYQLVLSQNRILKEKIASYSENTFINKDKTIISYNKKRLMFWLKKGVRLGRYPISKRVGMLVVKSAAAAAIAGAPK